MEELEPYTHPELGFTMQLPAGIEIGEEVPGVALLARTVEEAAISPFRANLTVVAERLPAGTDAEGYTDQSLAAQEPLLESYYLIDRAPAVVGGRPATRTLGHHAFQAHAVALEQWRVVDGDTGYVISASCEALEYDSVADGFAACAESFRPGVSA